MLILINTMDGAIKDIYIDIDIYIDLDGHDSSFPIIVSLSFACLSIDI